MSEEKTIEIGGIEYHLPFFVDYETLNVPRISDQTGCPLYRSADNDDMEAIVTALNFQHVTFPAMLARLKERRDEVNLRMNWDVADGITWAIEELTDLLEAESDE